MNQTDFTFGFRIVGGCYNERRLVKAKTAFVKHAECDPLSEPEKECYLSAFQFADDFVRHLDATRSTKGFTGPTWAAWLWFDIDRDDFEAATMGARRLVAGILDRYSLAGDELLIFYSGSKGFHVGLPTGLWNAEPCPEFHLQCRRFAEAIAESSNVAIDSGVYDRVRAFRAPNSRHQKTGRHKRFLGLDELMSLQPDRIVELAAEPTPFDLPRPPGICCRAVEDWHRAGAAVELVQSDLKQRRQANGSGPKLIQQTRDFIREGAPTGERHPRLFSAAANLAEFGCGFDFAWALLAESALDSGLPPSEVRRQIECGLNHGREFYQPTGLIVTPPEPSGMEAGN